MVRSHDKPIHSQPGLHIQTYKNIILKTRGIKQFVKNRGLLMIDRWILQVYNTDL